MNDRDGERFLVVAIVGKNFKDREIKRIVIESFLYWMKVLVLSLENLQ